MSTTHRFYLAFSDYQRLTDSSIRLLCAQGIPSGLRIRYTEFMKDKWLQSVLQMSPAERVRIAQLIWESVEELPDSDQLSDDQRIELSRRLEDLEKNGSKGRPWREVLSDIINSS